MSTVSPLENLRNPVSALLSVYGYDVLMPTGSQGPAEGLAKKFAEYVQHEMSARGWSFDDLASRMSMSRSYIHDRVAKRKIFTVRDFEEFAGLVGLEPQELLARIQTPFGRMYDGRLVPKYGVIGDENGMHFYRSVDADPPLRDTSNVIAADFGVRGANEDELDEVAGEGQVDHEEDQDDYDG